MEYFILGNKKRRGNLCIIMEEDLTVDALVLLATHISNHAAMVTTLQIMQLF